jgi:putative transposase
MELEVESLTGAAHGERSPGPDQFTATAIASGLEDASRRGRTAYPDEPVKAMGMTGISKSQVRRLCAEIDEKIAPFSTGRWKAICPISGWIRPT